MNRTMHKQHPNKALHPTARSVSVVVFPALSLGWQLVVTGGRRASLALAVQITQTLTSDQRKRAYDEVVGS